MAAEAAMTAARTHSLTILLRGIDGRVLPNINVSVNLVGAAEVEPLSAPTLQDGSQIGSVSLTATSDERGRAVFHLIPSMDYLPDTDYEIRWPTQPPVQFTMPTADITLYDLRQQAPDPRPTPTSGFADGQIAIVRGHVWVAGYAVTLSAEAPTNPFTSQVWVDSDDYSMHIWDGDAWQSVASGSGGGVSPAQLQAETQAREAADTALGGRIDGLNIPAAATAAPGNTPGTPAVGRSTKYAREDHDHGITGGGSGGDYWGKVRVAPDNIIRADNLDGTYQITLSDAPVDALTAAGVNAVEIWFGNEAIELINPWTVAETDVFSATIDVREETRIGLTTQDDIRVLVVFRVRSGGSSRFIGQAGTILTIGQVGTASSSDIANEASTRGQADTALGNRIDGLSIPDPSDAAPGNTPGSPSAGTSADYARADHDHGITPGTDGGTDQTARDAAAAAQLDVDTVIEIGPPIVHNISGPVTLSVSLRHPQNAYSTANVLEVAPAGQTALLLGYDNTLHHQDSLFEVSAADLNNIWSLMDSIPDGQGGTTRVQRYSVGSYIPVAIRLRVGRGGDTVFFRVVDLLVVAPDDNTLEFASTVQQVAGTDMQTEGSRDIAARADHVHGLPLAAGSGLSFNASDELNSENLNETEVNNLIAAALRRYTPPAATIPSAVIGSALSLGNATLRGNTALTLTNDVRATVIMVNTKTLPTGASYDNNTGLLTLGVGSWDLLANISMMITGGSNDRSWASVAILEDVEGPTAEVVRAEVSGYDWRDPPGGQVNKQVGAVLDVIDLGSGNDSSVVRVGAMFHRGDNAVGATVRAAWLAVKKLS